MFYPAPASSDPHTLSEPTPDDPDRSHHGLRTPASRPGCTLLAAAGLSSRAIREIVGSPPGVGADG